MSLKKKVYTSPKIIIYGDVETITQQGGGNRIDVPLGTAIGPNTTIGDVTGKLS